MARIAFGPLVISASGKVGDTVFSKWKGTPYIRSRVTPANPKSTDQQRRRNMLLYGVQHWQELASDIKTRWGEYASPYGMSGYNKWCSANIPAMAHVDALKPAYTPANKDVAGPTDFAAVPGAASGQIACSWLQGAEGAGMYIEVICLKEGTLYYQEAIKLSTHEAVLSSVHAVTLTGLTAAAVYAVSACIYDSNRTDNKFSQAYGTVNVTALA